MIKHFYDLTKSLRYKNRHASMKLLVAILLLSFVSLPNFTLANGFSHVFRILQDDTLAIYIRPVVKNLSAEGSSSDSNSFRVAFFTNETQYSLVYMVPRSEGNYNLTISFRTESAWNYTVGVFTDSKEFYPSSDFEPLQYGGYLVRLYPLTTISSPGNFTLTFIVSAQRRSPSFFSFIEFPTSINAVLFIAVIALLGYVNAFFLLDLNFKRKIESVSRKHWFLLGLLIIASVYVIYQIYSFTTFTPIWSV